MGIPSLLTDSTLVQTLVGLTDARYNRSYHFFYFGGGHWPFSLTIVVLILVLIIWALSSGGRRN